MQRPRLSFLQIWNMSFGFFGVQVGFGLQNANVSRIFQTLGAEVDEVAILWIAAPLTGLLVQPIIGYMSDRTWAGWLGRRRPYFLVGAILTTLALVVMPNSPTLWIAAGMLWIMDASLNITMEPFRAFVGDMLPDEQRTTGFAMQSFVIGSGAVLASALPWILTEWFSVANTAAEGEVPQSLQLAFYIGSSLLLVSVLWTVFTTREYTPEQLAAFEEAAKAARAGQNSESDGEGRQPPHGPAMIWNGWMWLILGGVATILIAQFALEKELYILSTCGVAFGLMQVAAGLLKQRGQTDNPFSEIIDDLFVMPKTMRQLAVVQFFSWFALFSMWIYATPGVAAYHYGTSDPTSPVYNEGANWVGLLFAVYNGFAALAAFGIPVLAARTSRKIAHLVCLSFGGLGLLSFIWIGNPALLWTSMIGVGIAWASILSMPYAILSGALPAQKMGIYMGIFNFFIVIPQLLAASILGLFVRELFDGQAIYALALGGASLFVAGLATLMVDDVSDVPGQGAAAAMPAGH